MYKSIVKSVKAGSYLGAVPGGGCAGLTEEGVGGLCFKGEEGEWRVKPQGHEC